MPKRSDIVQLRIRLHGPLLKQLKASAKRNEVSLNGEVVKRLNDSFWGDGLSVQSKSVAKSIMDAWREYDREQVREEMRQQLREELQKEQK